MQIGSTISEIHLKNTHFAYTVAAPAPQNTPDCENRVNTPASVKCRQVSPNSSLIHYVKLYISIQCIYTPARIPHKRANKPFGNLSWVHVMSHFALCSNSIQSWFELYLLIYKNIVDSQALCLHLENVFKIIICFGFIEFMYVTGKYGEYHDVKTDITWVSQTASSIIYVYRVYVCLCIFRKINWPYAPNHNYFAILFSCEDEPSLSVTKILRNDNKLFIRIQTQKCNLRYAHKSRDIWFSLIYFDIYFLWYTQAVYIYITKDIRICEERYIVVHKLRI